MAPLADQHDRDRAIFARGENVILDAGAGTGKTTALVLRLVELVAPSNDEHPATSIDRIAAITFTRKAAGELRLKIRERLLAELGGTPLSATRRDRLLDALAGLDTAHVGTIHSFADRLLRHRPVEAELSPSYVIVEDGDDLVHEAFETLMLGAETGTLSETFADTELAEEAEETLLAALRAGLLAESREHAWGRWAGLDALVADFIARRDIQVPPPPAPTFDLATFQHYADELLELIAPLGGASAGVRAFRSLGRALEEARQRDDPAQIYALVARPAVEEVARLNKRRDFDNDEPAWNAYKAFDGDERKRPVRARPLRDDLLEPLRAWLAARLVRVIPIALEVYDRVKARHRAVDQVDLLMKLRELLRDPTLRAEYQGLFDHIFVDEFQDTDPLQAEVILYLCEDGTRATSWQDVEVAPGKLTIVGDPKQSIYRFRRADIEMYDQVRNKVASSKSFTADLSTNFRSHPSLLEWFNHRFRSVLGEPPSPGVLFNPTDGAVFHRDLAAGRTGASGPRVRALVVESPEGNRADPLRAAEARALATYLRHLVEESGETIVDPLTGGARAVEYGDIAVLALSTRALPVLFRELDALDVPYASRGGELFLGDPLHRQLMLGLRALADPDDGVATAALMRSPFFAIDLADLVAARSGSAAADDPRVARVERADDLIAELRERRHLRPVGETARDLLERTAFARTVALEPNGAMRLEALRELCAVLEQIAHEEQLDFDAASARLRDWVSNPIKLDPPMPVGGTAIQVTTVHQAKGLEFPVVIWWDGRARWRPRTAMDGFRGDSAGNWRLKIDLLEYEHPRGSGMIAREANYLENERARLVYVAATRARDLLILPWTGTPSSSHICGKLLEESPADAQEDIELFRADAPPAWARGVEPRVTAEPEVGTRLFGEVTRAWHAALEKARAPHLVPVAVTADAHARAEAIERELAMDDMVIEPRPGRFGAAFGSVVHRAIAWVLLGHQADAETAVTAAADEVGVRAHLAQAIGDVQRTLDALSLEGLLDGRFALEYPVAGPSATEQLLVGSIDFLAADDTHLSIVDFKTDQPPDDDVAETHRAYVKQIASYEQLVAGIAAGRSVRKALLFTADGAIWWV